MKFALFKHTPWFVSPVAAPCDRCAPDNAADCQPIHYEKRRILQSTCAKPRPLPIFKEHHEASSIQLFYDLFFVANLCTFTANHEIEDVGTLASYLLFFTLMWFTWFGTILFDVRFAIDSWFTRLNKACSFGVMTGFAIVSARFDTTNENESSTFRHTSFILMASRILLVIQYGVVLVAVRRRHREPGALQPFVLTICTTSAAALTFLGLYWNITSRHRTVAFYAW
jgi:low temperature requirement protein LtrA